MLQPYLSNTATPNVLELFARSTSAGIPGGENKSGRYVAIGNEAIKFNEIGHYLLPREVARAPNL